MDTARENAAQESQKPAQMAAHFVEAPSSRLPLVVEPPSAAERPLSSLLAWIADQSASIERDLTQHGAVLFRGFDVRTALDFERVARAISPDLKNAYLGTSPRDALTEYVFSASELPPYYPIPQHCEMSFLKDPPSRLFFCCLVAPAGQGGETPLVDFRKVLRDLDPDVRARFEEKGVKNIRNYSGPSGGSRLDPWKLKRWDEMFGSKDRAAVEQVCRQNGLDYEWKQSGELRLTNVQAATRAHPKTGEPVWFNHSQVFHTSSAAGEYRRIAARMGRLRYRFLGEFARAAVTLKARVGSPMDQAMHCTFGDGTPIEDRDMELVRDAIWDNLVFVRWRAGDVVAIDNFAIGHGRMPYEGPRKVAVCWA